MAMPTIVPSKHAWPQVRALRQPDNAQKSTTNRGDRNQDVIAVVDDVRRWPSRCHRPVVSAFRADACTECLPYISSSLPAVSRRCMPTRWCRPSHTVSAGAIIQLVRNQSFAWERSLRQENSRVSVCACKPGLACWLINVHAGTTTGCVGSLN
jgi:hypothetical protein